MIKKRPKQNFKINYLEILDSGLSKAQKDILMELLGHHKKNCKYEYKPLYNTAICKKLEYGKDSFAKNRQTLVDVNLITLKKVRSGRVMLIHYHFKWAKLLKLKFIIPIEQSEFKPKFKKNIIPYFNNGHKLSIEDITKLKAENVYQLKKYRLDNDCNRLGNGIAESMKGSQLKSMIQIQDREKEFEYIILNKR